RDRVRDRQLCLNTWPAINFRQAAAAVPVLPAHSAIGMAQFPGPCESGGLAMTASVRRGQFRLLR
ncbi:hypothetical protein, partial [Escherichia coli]|uniref:hypothetical protein n=1 Tax=Escherichia coli TaxID=562 RepID=UPI0019542C47